MCMHSFQPEPRHQGGRTRLAAGAGPIPREELAPAPPGPPGPCPRPRWPRGTRSGAHCERDGHRGGCSAQGISQEGMLPGPEQQAGGLSEGNTMGFGELQGRGRLRDTDRPRAARRTSPPSTQIHPSFDGRARGGRGGGVPSPPAPRPRPPAPPRGEKHLPAGFVTVPPPRLRALLLGTARDGGGGRGKRVASIKPSRSRSPPPRVPGRGCAAAAGALPPGVGRDCDFLGYFCRCLFLAPRLNTL